MEIILKEDIASLGKTGEVVKVKPGFARNYLLPQGLAVLADPKNLKELEHHKRMATLRQAKLKKQAEGLSQTIASLSLVIKKEAGEEDKMFGQVAVKDIVESLRKEKIFLEKKQIQLETPIKTLGDYEVVVKLHPEVRATLKVSVVKG